ncbi:hypothetical protein [Natronocalculus amylovorans]|uniref:Nucleotide modification associated domain-containing protein n=1 Tax=Natronocalculus amylovorans TaxID=2917812 RepID=A0AAE3FWT1_9EURY|nr:hypothetical protein [Natronocalculus amylovorans]MCL9816804.1 hypothetical protein [Natronocalculus amylovorans]NUE01244.1 hypothetical protein [Halorubraceae archaeon YAN]
MARSLAINVAANTNIPGFRGPIYPDGSFVYLPIPEREPIAELVSVPTYGELIDHLDPLPFAVSAEVREQHVHLDPEFAGYPFCETYTYGDEHGVKAGPISELEPGDWLYFYATLTRHEPPASVSIGTPQPWVTEEWGTYIIGAFHIESILSDPLNDPVLETTSHPYLNNAHLKRDPIDPEVLVLGTEQSALFDRAIPLSSPDAGATANKIVTDLSNDSGKGPWWRRRLWFDPDASETLRSIVENRSVEPWL